MKLRIQTGPGDARGSLANAVWLRRAGRVKSFRLFAVLLFGLFYVIHSLRGDDNENQFHTFFLETASDYRHSAVYKTVYKNSGILLKNSDELVLDYLVESASLVAISGFS
jgi:hypothetical protein